MDSTLFEWGAGPVAKLLRDTTVDDPLLVYGGNGVGKTTLCGLACVGAIQKQQTCAFIGPKYPFQRLESIVQHHEGLSPDLIEEPAVAEIGSWDELVSIIRTAKERVDTFDHIIIDDITKFKRFNSNDDEDETPTISDVAHCLLGLTRRYDVDVLITSGISSRPSDDPGKKKCKVARQKQLRMLSNRIRLVESRNQTYRAKTNITDGNGIQEYRIVSGGFEAVDMP